MRKRLVKGVALLAVIAVGGFAAIEFFKPRLRIDDESLAKIRKGMTEADVERILGGPAGEYGYGDSELLTWTGDSFGWWVLDKRVWRGENLAILVSFDEDGRVWHCGKVDLFRRYASLWDMLLQKLNIREKKVFPRLQHTVSGSMTPRS